MAKNTKSDVAKKAGIIGGAVLGASALGGGAVYGANAYMNRGEEPLPETEDELEMEVEEDVEVEYDEPVEAEAPVYTGHAAQHVEVDPVVADANDVALVVEPEDEFIDGIADATEEAIEVAEVMEEDFNVDDVVNDILSDDTTQLSYEEPADDHEFGADFDYQSDMLG